MTPLTPEEIAEANREFDAMCDRLGIPDATPAEPGKANAAIVTVGRLPPSDDAAPGAEVRLLPT